MQNINVPTYGEIFKLLLKVLGLLMLGISMVPFVMIPDVNIYMRGLVEDTTAEVNDFTRRIEHASKVRDRARETVG